MNRREFLKKSIYYGTAVAAGYLLGGFNKFLSSALLKAAAVRPDLVALKGGEPEVMFDKGIALLGGMANFVKKNQVVVVKPNIGWDVPPERAANTNPKLVGRIIEHCLQAGAKKVYVFDHTCNYWQNCYTNSGIEYIVKEKGGQMAPAHSKGYYQKVTIPQGQNLKTAEVHELIMEADVFINVPVLKDHSGATMTVSMKNLMGIVWNRGYWHSNDLHQCIADFSAYRKPDLNIVDAYRVMMDNGPRGVSESDVSLMKTQLISTDMVAVDAAATKIFGRNPADIGYIRAAYEKKLGNMNLDQLKIERITL